MKTEQQSFFNNTSAQYHWDNAIALLKEFENEAIARSLENAQYYNNPIGYAVGYSGGKDSDLLVKIFKASGVKFFVFHNHTTIDAPETVYYIRKRFKEWTEQGITCKVYYPERSFWRLCEHKGILPSRIMRFCCSELKEHKVYELNHLVHSFGVRKAESVNRTKNREDIELHNKADYSDKVKFCFDSDETTTRLDAFACSIANYHHFTINPLANFPDNIVKELLERDKINPLYSEGFCRVGCVGCPMAGFHRIAEFERAPKYKDTYVRLCNRIMDRRISLGLSNKLGFKNGTEYFEHWLYEPKKLEVMENQIEMGEYAPGIMDAV